MSRLVGLVMWMLLGAVLMAEGSIVGVVCTRERCVAASDSRATTAGGVYANDSARKIDSRHGWLFGTVGDPVTFTAWRSLPDVAGESAKARAHRLLSSVRVFAETRSTIMLARLGSFYAAKVRMVPGGSYEIVEGGEAAAPLSLLLGWDDGAAVSHAWVDRLRAAADQNRPEAEVTGLMATLLTAAAQQSRKVGGGQHVAVLDRAGARWVTGGPDAEHWDGTRLLLASASVKIDDTGIFLQPSPGGSWGNDYAYRWDVGASGRLGSGGFLTSAFQGLQLESRYTGASTALGTSVQIVAEDAPSSGGSALATITAFADYNGGATSRVAIGASEIWLDGIPDFRGGSSATAVAGAATLPSNPVGFINVTVSGVAYRIPVYNP